MQRNCLSDYKKERKIIILLLHIEIQYKKTPLKYLIEVFKYSICDILELHFILFNLFVNV